MHVHFAMSLLKEKLCKNAVGVMQKKFLPIVQSEEAGQQVGAYQKAEHPDIDKHFSLL